MGSWIPNIFFGNQPITYLKARQAVLRGMFPVRGGSHYLREEQEVYPTELSGALTVDDNILSLTGDRHQETA